LNVNARVAVDAIFQWNRLSVFDIGRFPFDQTHIVPVHNLFGTFFSTKATGNTQRFIDVSWMLNQLNAKVSCFALNFVNFAESS